MNWKFKYLSCSSPIQMENLSYYSEELLILKLIRLYTCIHKNYSKEPILRDESDQKSKTVDSQQSSFNSVYQDKYNST